MNGCCPIFPKNVVKVKLVLSVSMTEPEQNAFVLNDSLSQLLSPLSSREAGKDTGRTEGRGGWDTKSLGFGKGGTRLSMASLTPSS